MEYNKIEWNEGILRNIEIISTPAQGQGPSRCFHGECQSWNLALNFLTSCPQSFPRCHGTYKDLSPTNAHDVVGYSRLIILKIHVESQLFAY